MVTTPQGPESRKPRGVLANPTGRFERLAMEPIEGSEAHGRETVLLRDVSKSVISRNQSPDVRFDLSLNPYRGCSTGCVYCYARPGHEYLGLSAGLDFETRILVKTEAPELLRRELSSPRWVPRTVLMSGVTDPYQPVEKSLGLTRRCLEVLAEARQPVAVITKSSLIRRDIDLLSRLAESEAVAVTISVTTLRDELHRKMEPRGASPGRRLATIRALASAGVPVCVNVAPVIPGLTDHEIPSILGAAAAAGACGAAWIALRLPHGVASLFESWLERHFPDRKEKVLGRVRSMRGGRLNDPRFGSRMKGEGPFAEHIRQSFHVHRRRLGLRMGPPTLSAEAFRRPSPPARPAVRDPFQTELFIRSP
jgi:DNA repair photolyase